MLAPPLRVLLAAVGVFVLADSLSQLVVSMGSWNPGSVPWRVTSLRMVFSQVTPVMIAGLLLGTATVRSDTACRRAGLVALASSLLVALLAAVLLSDGRPAPGGEPADRGMLQALASAAAGVLGLALAGVRLLRAGRPALPAPPRSGVA